MNFILEKNCTHMCYVQINMLHITYVFHIIYVFSFTQCIYFFFYVGIPHGHPAAVLGEAVGWCRTLTD